METLLLPQLDTIRTAVLASTLPEHVAGKSSKKAGMAKLKHHGVQTIYVSGPMSGIVNFNYDAFNAVAEILRDAGYNVVNPAETDGGDQTKSWHDYMRADIQVIINECDALVLLQDWANSPGACVEVNTARAIGIPVWDISEVGIHVENNEPDPDFYAIDHPLAPDAVKRPEIIDINTVGEAPTFETILDEAKSLVYGERQGIYDHPLDNFRRIAEMWSTYLGIPITEEQHAVCMVLVKVARLMNTPQHRDSIVDIAGYMQTYAMLQEERDKRGQ